ncbi:MAG: LysR family transcriptional regulator [Steroidobacteraceae bacterium]|nr:LysR family transcriptional regulator [Gammaproteobacteria bacterium]NCW21626.1 LysR family transcriptional regulator [Gammaproteobacteria bacterium]
MAILNFHHLRYFWVIAHERSLTKAAARLHVSASALSIQLRQLEERLGQALFERKNRRIELTEGGRIALEYADAIFRSGEELVSTLKGSARKGRAVLRVGAVATLSRNFQIGWLRPLLGRDDVELVLRSGTLNELLVQLAAHSLDVVLTNASVPRDAKAPWRVFKIGEQEATLVGRPSRKHKKFRFPDDLRQTPIVLPGPESSLRESFDTLMEQAGIRPLIAAEVDDMAMLRLVARESKGVALVPPVVVKDELERGTLVQRARVTGLKETFYAVTASRRFGNPLLKTLLMADGG